MFLIEVDRVLKPGGYFVLTSPGSRQRRGSLGSKRGNTTGSFQEFIQKLCWNLLSEQEETFIWQKTTDPECYASRYVWLSSFFFARNVPYEVEY